MNAKKRRNSKWGSMFVSSCQPSASSSSSSRAFDSIQLQMKRFTWKDSALYNRLSLELLDDVGGLAAEVEFDGEEVEMLLAVVWLGLECSARLSELSDSSEVSSLDSSWDRLGTKILRFEPATKGPLDMLDPGPRLIFGKTWSGFRQRATDNTIGDFEWCVRLEVFRQKLSFVLSCQFWHF